MGIGCAKSNGKCNECKGDIIAENGEYVCSRCGLVVSNELAESALSVASYLVDNLSCGEKAHSSLGERLHIVDSLGSYIDYHNKGYFCDSQGEPLPCKGQALFRRLKYNYDLKARTDKRETDYNALRVLNRVSVLLRISESVRNRAAYYYRKITSSKLCAEVSNKLITVATCLFMAIREFKECAPVTIQELADVFRGLGHRVSVRSIVRELPRLQGKLNLNVHIRRSEEYLNRLISTVVTQPEIQSRINESRISVEEYKCGIHSAALSMLKELDSSIRGGRNPFILAVSSIYAADRKVSESRGIKPILTQRILARATGTAEYSLRDHFCSLLKKKCNSASKKENEQVSVNKPQRE